MAYFDEARGAVVARVLYDGLGTAGKTSSVRKLREIFSQRSGDVFVPEEKNGRTLYFDWLEVEAGHFDAYPLRVEVMTVPGQWAYAHRRWMLLNSADALIAVVDSTDAGLLRASYALTFLRKVLRSIEAPPPLIVQAHKQDLPDAMPVDRLRAELRLVEPMIATSAVTGDGLREAFVTAVKGARDQVRRKLAGRHPSALAAPPESPDALCDRMRAAEHRGTDLEGEKVLDEVLDEIEQGPTQ